MSMLFPAQLMLLAFVLLFLLVAATLIVAIIAMITYIRRGAPERPAAPQRD